MGKEDKKQKNIKLRVVLISIICIILLAGLWIYLCAKVDVHIPILDSEIQAFTQQEEKIGLYTDKFRIFTGEAETIEFTVKLRDDLCGEDICIVNDEEEILFTIHSEEAVKGNDGYTYYEISKDICFAENTVCNYYAKSGEYTSLPVKLVSGPHITEGDVKECNEVGRELSSYMADVKQDVSMSEYLAVALKKLQSDERVSDAVINADSVLFVTKHNVMGVFSPSEGEDCFGESQGFDDSKETLTVYERELETGSVRTKGQVSKITYLDGINAPTNSQFLILSPLYNEDDECRKSTDVYENCAVFARDNYGCEYKKEANNSECLSRILRGELAQNGLVNLITHGGYFIRSDESFMTHYDFGEYTEFGFSQKQEEANKYLRINKNSEVYDYLYMTDHMNVDHTFLALYFDEKKPKENAHLLVTTNFIKEVYVGQKFDNTLLYIGACYGTLDETMIQQFMNSGAMAILGYHVSINVEDERELYQKSFKKIVEERITLEAAMNPNTSLFIPISGINNKWEDARNTLAKPFVVAYNVVVHPIKTIQGAKTNKKGLNRETPKGQEYKLYGYGRHLGWQFIATNAIEGKIQKQVVTVKTDVNGYETKEENILPVKKCEVEIYRFLNQSFLADKAKSVKTNKSGEFTFDVTGNGVYGVTVTGEDILETNAAFTAADDKSGVGELLVPAYGAHFEGIVFNNKDENQPVAGAEIGFKLISAEMEADQNIERNNFITTTDQEGRFAYELIPGGQYEITIEKDGVKAIYTSYFKNGYVYLQEKPFYLVDGYRITNMEITGYVWRSSDWSDVYVKFSCDINDQSIESGAGGFVSEGGTCYVHNDAEMKKTVGYGVGDIDGDGNDELVFRVYKKDHPLIRTESHAGNFSIFKITEDGLGLETVKYMDLPQFDGSVVNVAIADGVLYVIAGKSDSSSTNVVSKKYYKVIFENGQWNAEEIDKIDGADQYNWF